MADDTTPALDPAIPTQPAFDYTKERTCYDKIIGSWQEEKQKVTVRRDVRRNAVNVNEKRAAGKLLPHETEIPDRTVNTNIKRGKVPYLSYVTQAQNILIITDLDAPDRNLEPLQLWFTRGMRYPHWKVPYERGIDGFHVHGGIGFEVVYDPSKPFNVGIEYIRREDLLISPKCKDIQTQRYLPRAYEITSLQLEEFARTYNFDKEVTDKLLDRYKDKEDQCLTIYRVLCKKDGVVYNSWYAPDAENWLRAPVVHQIGLFDINPIEVLQTAEQLKSQPGPSIDPLTGQPGITWDQYRQNIAANSPYKLKMYPIFWFRYEETEDDEILKCQGRVALDIHTQEALTHLFSNTVNASTLASGIYASAESEPGSDPKLMELGTFKSGFVYSHKVSFFTPPWPNNIVLPIMQALGQQNAQQSGNQDFATVARKDANKTAKEMELAAAQSQEISGTDVSMFSSPYLDMNALCFLVAQHQALLDLCSGPQDKTMLIGNFHLEPAGDTEVIKKAEDRANAEKFFNIVQGTPAAEKVLKFLVERFFPDQADEWIAALETPDQTGMMNQLIQLLQAIPPDAIPEQFRTQFQQIVGAAQSMVAGPDNAGVSQPA